MSDDLDSTSVFRTLSDDDVRQAIDAQLSVGVLSARGEPEPLAGDSFYYRSTKFWEDALSDRLRYLRVVNLYEFNIFEWFPRSPGLYHTASGKASRAHAQMQFLELNERDRAAYIDSSPLEPHVYNLHGKMDMLNGGIGCFRLDRRVTAEGPLWFMSASSGSVVEEGIPIGLTDDDYSRVIDTIVVAGAVYCERITGTLRRLPEDLLGLYRGYTGVPRLYVAVESIDLGAQPAELEAPPRASGAVLFSTEESYTSRKGVVKIDSTVHAAYIDFFLAQRPTLTDRLPFLEHYVSLYGGSVITDFDEQMSRFADAVFSLRKVTNGMMSGHEMEETRLALRLSDAQIGRLIGDQARLIVNVRKEIYMGDVYQNIGAGAVIVNRSVLSNALNSVQASFGDEAAEQLDTLSNIVHESGDIDAIENFNGLSEELAKPSPSHSRLRTWLGAILNALPEVASTAEAVTRLTALLLGN